MNPFNDMATLDLPTQGNILRVIIVIKDKDQVALERFIFSVQNMIEVEAYNRDVRYGRPASRGFS